MTDLWIAFAVLLLLAFGFLCWPLLNRKQRVYAKQQQENIDMFRDRLDELEQEKLQGNLEQADFLVLKAELEKTLLQDAQMQEDQALASVNVNANYWVFALFLGLAVTGVSLTMYFSLGRSDDLLISQTLTEPTATAKNKQQSSIEQSIAILEARLAEDPENDQMLLLLANSYSAVGQFVKGADIYARMAEKAKDIPEQYAGLKGAQAQSLFQASGDQFTASVKRLTEQALTADPEEPSSLMLLGINAFTLEQYQQAIDFWQKATIKAGETQVTRFIKPAIKAAEAKSGRRIAQQTQDLGSPRITIDLTLSASLKAQVSGEQVVFVFARPVGGRMPLAAERIKVKDLPIRIVLDDSKAAMPTAKLSSVDQVEITARISLSGQPMAQKGDLYTTVKNVVVKQNPTLTLEINQVVQ